MKPEHKKIVIEEVIRRIIADKISTANSYPLENIVNDTIYHERKRLDSTRANRKTNLSIQYWKRMNKRMHESPTLEQKKELIAEISRNFVGEIIGNFNPQVYNFSTKALPILLSLFLNAISPRIFSSHFPHLPNLDDRLIICGEVDLIRSLSNLGTIILVPTHASHLDSIVVGWALHKIGLPPFIYGAAINLFRKWPFGYFISNLGAYRVDRQKTASLYKDVLKEYTTCTLEMGYNNLFFPGGTRCRSGEIEPHIKLGLLGTGLRAYINNINNNKSKPNIYVIPCTISYQLVLEAESLIQEQLKAIGKSEYILEDDEFSRLVRFINFLTGVLRLDSRIYIRFCPAMDVFGNLVNLQGLSYDKRGRVVDITRYISSGNKISPEPQRDMQYTRELGEEICKSYLKNNVIMSTHLVAFVIHELLEKHNPEKNLYTLLRTGGKEEQISLSEIYKTIERILAKLKKLENQGGICLDDQMKTMSVDKIFDEALHHFQIYHSKNLLERVGDWVKPADRSLLYYYHNRLKHYSLEKEIKG